jgi:flagellar biosynthesis protein FlhF
MKIKTFYARTMAEALVEIKSSLGPEALILSSKPLARRSGLGSAGIQVVAATDNRQAHIGSSVDDLADLTARPPETEDGPVPDNYTPKARTSGILSDEAGEIPLQSEASEARGPARANYPLQIYHDLIANDFSGSLASELVGRACRALDNSGRMNRERFLGAICDAARQMVVPSLQGEGMPGKQYVVFLGSAGAGKTTAIAKLAAHLAMRHDKNVALFTLDTYGIGAIDQMRTYASLMGLPFRAVSDLAELRTAMADHSRRDFILVDTPGRYRQDTAAVSEMMQHLRGTGNVECHVVLSATTKPCDLSKMTDWYQPYDYLVFTKLDETSTLGPILSELTRTQKPLSYLSDGQRIPDDLHAATPARIVDAVLNAINNGARTWNEPASLDFISIPSKPRSRQLRKPRKSIPPALTRKRRGQEQEL